MGKKHPLTLVVLTALIGALCAIGSFIKVPGFITTAALDSAPAFISVVFLPPLYSGFAGAIGHFATAFTSGFPFGPLHILIAVEMFVIVLVFNLLHRHHFKILKWVFLIGANGILSALPFYFLISPSFFIGVLPSLIIATLLNGMITWITMPILNKVLTRRRVHMYEKCK